MTETGKLAGLDHGELRGEAMHLAWSQNRLGVWRLSQADAIFAEIRVFVQGCQNAEHIGIVAALPVFVVVAGFSRLPCGVDIWQPCMDVTSRFVMAYIRLRRGILRLRPQNDGILLGRN